MQFRIFIFSTLIIILLTACGGYPRQTVLATETLMIVSNPPSEPSSLKTETTPTQEIISASATATYTSTITSTATFYPTLTPIPTLNTEQAIEKIKELFKTNGGCQLPCWWGITPGVSQSDIAFNFLQGISQKYDYNASKDKSSEGVEFFFFDLPIDIQYYGDSFLEGRVYADKGIVTQIRVEGFDFPSYRLPAFLHDNGKPDEIWIFAYRMYDTNADLPFSVYLLYSKKGMLLTYSGPARQHKDLIEGCIDTSPEILIWPSSESLTFAEAQMLRVNEFNSEEYKHLIDATKGQMDTDQFYEKFKDSTGNPCIEIDANLWEIIR